MFGYLLRRIFSLSSWLIEQLIAAVMIESNVVSFIIHRLREVHVYLDMNGRKIIIYS
jgi:hypothetical protein